MSLPAGLTAGAIQGIIAGDITSVDRPVLQILNIFPPSGMNVSKSMPTRKATLALSDGEQPSHFILTDEAYQLVLDYQLEPYNIVRLTEFSASNGRAALMIVSLVVVDGSRADKIGAPQLLGAASGAVAGTSAGAAGAVAGITGVPPNIVPQPTPRVRQRIMAFLRDALYYKRLMHFEIKDANRAAVLARELEASFINGREDYRQATNAFIKKTWEDLKTRYMIRHARLTSSLPLVREVLALSPDLKPSRPDTISHLQEVISVLESKDPLQKVLLSQVAFRNVYVDMKNAENVRHPRERSTCSGGIFCVGDSRCTVPCVPPLPTHMYLTHLPSSLAFLTPVCRLGQKEYCQDSALRFHFTLQQQQQPQQQKTARVAQK
jgi:hypothetical protein